MTKVKNSESVFTAIAEISNQAIREISGPISLEAIDAQVLEEVLNRFDPEDLAQELLRSVISKKVKDQAKANGLLNALSGDQIEMFPDYSDKVISLGGIVVKVKDADQSVWRLQENALFENKLNQDRAFVKKMDYIRPIIGVMEEYHCDYAGALAILRSRQ
jgi:hypothetical protein